MTRTMTSKSRKVAAALLSAAFAATVAFPIGIAYANNSANTSYDVSTDQNVTWTPARTKMDCTSSWQRMNYLTTTSVESYIDGALFSNSPIEVNSPRYSWSAGKEGFMDNYVKENGGYPNAILYFQSYAPRYRATGLWSPDCIGCPPCG